MKTTQHEISSLLLDIIVQILLFFSWEPRGSVSQRSSVDIFWNPLLMHAPLLICWSIYPRFIYVSSFSDGLLRVARNVGKSVPFTYRPPGCHQHHRYHRFLLSSQPKEQVLSSYSVAILHVLFLTSLPVEYLLFNHINYKGISIMGNV